MTLELETLPRDRAYHVWADYAELLCLVNLDREVSKADFRDRAQDRKDLGETSLESDDSDLSVPEQNDRVSQRVDDIFQYLDYREEHFGDFYPFSLSNDGNVLAVREPLSEKQRFYTFLLLASNLWCIKSSMDTITHSFERISAEAMRQMLPTNAEVHLFGPRHSESRYAGSNIYGKIRRLAKDINEKVRVQEDDLSPQSTGDKGLDIVAWVPIGDKSPTLPLWFAQCACTLKWTEKQYSSSLSNWKSYVSFTASPANFSFIPFCFRRANGSWYVESDISDVILIDRQRLIYLLQRCEDFIKAYPGAEVVDQAVEYRESAF